MVLALAVTCAALAADVQISASARLKGDLDSQALFELLNLPGEKLGTDALVKVFHTSDHLVGIDCRQTARPSASYDCEVRITSRSQGLNVGLGNGILVKDGEIIAMILNANDASALFDILKTDTGTESAKHFATADERLKISCTTTMCNVSISSGSAKLN
ncbi:MAG: hypothetical protein HY074_00465 [Deltaproteobacteria bacterium]|nr:hypothetical protein [Deltaproteobacteria bacterium]